jgi:hypothetical protein
VSLEVTVAVIGLTGGLVGALIGGVVSLATGWQSRRWAQRAWLLDSRRDAYLAVLAAVDQMNADVLRRFGDAAGPWVGGEDEIRTPLVVPLQRAELLGSRAVHDAIRRVSLQELRAYSDAPTKETAEALDAQMDVVTDLMRADLQSGRR